MAKAVIELLETVLRDIPDAQSWSLTFRPTSILSDDEVATLQDSLKYHFELWANSWVVPPITKAIAILKETQEEADEPVRQLNQIAPQPSNEQLTIALIAGMLVKQGSVRTVYEAVSLAREILDTVYKTESE